MAYSEVCQRQAQANSRLVSGWGREECDVLKLDVTYVEPILNLARGCCRTHNIVPEPLTD